MRYFWYGLLLSVAVVCFACADAVSPYGPPADLYGDLSQVAVQSGKYLIELPEGQAENVANVYVRWSVGTYTHQDGTTEPIWTYWQVVDYEVGREAVTIPCSSVPTAAADKEYWIKMD